MNFTSGLAPGASRYFSLEKVITAQNLILPTPVSVTKTCTPAVALPGGTVNCAVTVTNAGPVAATGVSFTDTSDPNLTFNPVSPQAGFTCTITNSDHTLGCTRSTNLPANSSATVNYTATLSGNSTPGTTYSNTVTLTGTNDNTPNDNTATAAVHTPSCTIGNPNATGPQALNGTQGNDVICGGSGINIIDGGRPGTNLCISGGNPQTHVTNRP